MMMMMTLMMTMIVAVMVEVVNKRLDHHHVKHGDHHPDAADGGVASVSAMVGNK